MPERCMYRVVSCRVVSCRVVLHILDNARKELYDMYACQPCQIICLVLNPIGSPLCGPSKSCKKLPYPNPHPAKANVSKITTLPANLFCLVLINKNVNFIFCETYVCVDSLVYFSTRGEGVAG